MESDISRKDHIVKVDSPRGLDIGVPSVGSVGSNAIMHSGSSLAIAVGREVIWVAPGYRVVALKVSI